MRYATMLVVVLGMLAVILGMLTGTGCSKSVLPPPVTDHGNNLSEQSEGAVQPDYAAAIDAVLRQERDVNSLMDEECEHEDFKIHVEAMGAIDLRSCPEDFRQAFLNHKYAWADVSSLLSRYQGQGLYGALTFVLEGATGIAMHRMEELDKRIEDTWRECESVAARHGANTAVYFRESRGLPGCTI